MQDVCTFLLMCFSTVSTPVENQKSSRAHRNSGCQCELGNASDTENDVSDSSITAESVSSSQYRLQRRPKSTPNHFRTQTAPSRLQHHRMPLKSSPRPGSVDTSDASSETSSHEWAYPSHVTCHVSHDAPGYYEYHRPISVYRKPLRRPLSLPQAFDDSEKLHHPDLNPGQREYLWHTASVYSVGNMKSLQQRRYRQILNHQVETGFHTREEVERYYKYLVGTRKRQYEADPSVWRNPPKLPVRPKYFHRCTRSAGDVDETRKINTGYYRENRSNGKKSSGKESKGSLNKSMEKLSLFYSTDLKRTLPRERKEEAKS
ncbi:uncharacterized protein [Diadema antillarum]|uniref:uncharacterized protein isoform X1 n=1 Tax=Diadema antillarum TaxID=105358 RepID=UPI003A83CF7D